MIVLNKTDLVSSQQQQQLQALLRKLNPSAHILPTSHSRVDVDQVRRLGSALLLLRRPAALALALVMPGCAQWRLFLLPGACSGAGAVPGGSGACAGAASRPLARPQAQP